MNRKRVSKAVVHQPAAQFYDRFVEAIKERIRSAQIKAALAANAQLVLHYWEIGRDTPFSAGISEALWLLRSQPQIHARFRASVARP